MKMFTVKITSTVNEIKKTNHADVDTKIDTVNHYFMHCLFNKEIEHQKILFYGSMSEFLVPFDLVVKEVTFYV